MSSIGGPGDVGGPKGPGGPDRPERDALAAEIAAGRLTPREAIDKLVDQIAGTDALGPTERAELREMLIDLVANDPYLAGLVGRV